MKSYDFRITNNINEIERIIEEVEQTAKENNIHQECIYKLNLVLDEILMNIISYGYTDNSEHFIDINILFDSEISITVTDEGKQFNPLEASIPDVNKTLEERTIGGLGLQIVRAMMDSITYKYENNKNILLLIKSTSKECE